MLFLLLTAIGFFIFLVWYLATSEILKRRWLGLACIACIVLNCSMSLFPLKKNVKLGLDLQGGTAYLLQLEGEPSAKAIEQATAVIRKRIDKFSLSETIIQPTGKNRISVQIPGLSDADKVSAREQLSKVAKLEFKLVDPNSSALLSQYKSGQPLPLENVVAPIISTDRDGKKVTGEIVLKRRTLLSGKHVKQAYRGYGQLGQPSVVMEFDDEGRQTFGEVTSQNIGHQLAIVLDGVVMSAPTIESAIYGTATINGAGITSTEAEQLSSILENPLETPVKILEERGVSPSLGRDSILSGERAGILALILVVLIMVVYYRIAGVIAVVALVINLVLLLGVLAQFHFTLTLPGIAGVILTIGMAVDANVLIYERIRDELAAGQPLPQAIQGGFDRAFSAIFDSNVTTILPALIVMWLGSGPLQGFAVTLTIGIIANLFAALVVTRNGFEWALSSGRLKRLTMLQLTDQPNIDFLGFRWAATLLSLLVIIGGMAVFTLRLDHLVGVDFTGGDSVTLSYDSPVSIGDVRSTLEKNDIRVGLLQYASTEKKLLLQTAYHQGERAQGLLQTNFPDAHFVGGGLESVGSVVGAELRNRAILALSVGLLAIFGYVSLRYEWTFALAAAVAQFHNVLVTVGILSLLGLEFNMTMVGAFLTILGYSINDKIVIFDRIREGLKNRERKTLYETINHAVNLTLARTLMTGGTVLLAIVSLLLLGGTVIHGFAVAMLIGVITGIYSSHLVAPTLVLWFSALKQKNQNFLIPQPSPQATPAK